MQKITIEVKDIYINNVLEMLQGLKGEMIEKIKYDIPKDEKVESDFIDLQINSMKDL